ncbi:MAG: hypothetical protein J4F43_00495 [Dehalococcoidia bacterium]|nr:hypothetical protein [Dehalococcoidia bacterium]
MSTGPGDPRPATLAEIEADLAKLPASVIEEYRIAKEAMTLAFKEEEVQAWAVEGVTIASQTARSWEAAVEYLRAGPEVAKFLPFLSFMQWARCGTYLAQDSPALACSYFKASPEVAASLRTQYIPRWAGLGRSLYKGTWKSSTLASRFFDVSPQLIRSLPFWDVEVFAALVEALSTKSYDVASECLVLGRNVLPQMGREREAFLSMGRALAEGSWREVKACLEVSGRVLPQVEESQRSRFLRLAERLTKGGQRETASFLLEGSQSLTQVNNQSQRYILDLCETLLAITPQAVPHFLKSLNTVLNRVTLNQLDVWFQEGVRLLKENPDGGLAYFKIESNTSEQLLETLSSSQELDRVKGVMRLYCRMLSGSSIEIMSSAELAHKGIGWVSESAASTEGSKVYLPPVVDRYPSKNENFGWFKVVSTHQVAHLEFESFGFNFELPSLLFDDLRPAMEKESVAGAVQRLQEALGPVVEQTEDDAASAERGFVTDMGRFFNLFDDRKLALDVFTILEDGRLDYRVKAEYAGIVRSYRQVQGDALAERPAIDEMPLLQCMVELLVRLSLEQLKAVPVPKKHVKTARVLAKVFKRLLHVDATVEDTAEATIRVYKILSELPNEPQSPEEFEPQDFDNQEEFSEEEFQELMQQLQQDKEGSQEEGEGQEGEEEEYESPEQVDFRGDFKPELVQLLNRLRMEPSQDVDGESQPITKEMLEELLKDNPELDLDPEAAELQDAMGMFAQNIMKEAGVPPPSSQPGQGHGPMVHEDEQGGALEAKEPRSQVYDEWDFRADDYKPKWCIVREKNVDEGDINFYNDTVRNFASLSSDIRRQFELVVPESFRKVKRVIDGEDLDLDAAIEATIDRKRGTTPSEKIWWRRNKLERDVAVVFLLDMSASTAEAIDEGRPTVDDHDAPDDPVEYMMWLRSRREGLVRRHYKRIIDLEKESTALLMQALETIGDTYGIYGFSGYGRENVEFYVIKDIDESFQDKIKRRIDKVTPMHATRMGPALRHATSKLEAQEAKTKILFLISDGRPQDRGYSREGVEKEYAVHDTHMALVEAKRKDVTPFCLTVDKAGHDYLKTMCGDMSYEVLDNIWTLPERLPTIYRMLTT